MAKAWKNDNYLSKFKEYRLDYDDEKTIYEDDNFEVIEYHQKMSTGESVPRYKAFSSDELWENEYVLSFVYGGTYEPPVSMNLRIDDFPNHPESFTKEIEIMKSVLESAKKISDLLGIPLDNE